MRAAYWKGVRLFEALQEAPAWAERTGSSDHEGLHQTYKTSNPESPNLERPITVKTVVEERSEQVSTYEIQDSIENTLHAVEALLIANMTVLGPLSYAPNDLMRASITTGHTAGTAQVVVIAAAQGGWAPATGQMVLVRNASTGHGFTTTITVSGSNITLALIPEDVGNSGWEMIFIVRSVASVQFQRMDGGKARGADDPQRDRNEVTYEFKGYGAVSYPSGSLLSGYTT